MTEHPPENSDESVVAVSIGEDRWLLWDDENGTAWVVTDVMVPLEAAR